MFIWIVDAFENNYQYKGNNEKIDRQYKKWYLYYLPILEGYSNQVLHFALLCFKIKSLDILGKVCRYINYSILISHMGLNKLVSRQFSCVQSWNLITLSFWASELNFFPLFSQKANPAQKKFAVEFFLTLSFLLFTVPVSPSLPTSRALSASHFQSVQGCGECHPFTISPLTLVTWCCAQHSRVSELLTTMSLFFSLK